MAPSRGRALDFATFLIQCLNSVQYGLLLFLVASGLTLIFGIMGILNIAHGSFYMFGAFVVASLVSSAAAHSLPMFWIALIVAPFLVGALGAVAEQVALAVDRLGCDTVIMGTRGKSAIGNLLMGSAATRVVHLVNVPVLLVK